MESIINLNLKENELNFVFLNKNILSVIANLFSFLFTLIRY